MISSRLSVPRRKEFFFFPIFKTVPIFKSLLYPPNENVGIISIYFVSFNTSFFSLVFLFMIIVFIFLKLFL